jgi:hypothetical protein
MAFADAKDSGGVTDIFVPLNTRFPQPVTHPTRGNVILSRLTVGLGHTQP